MKYSDNSAEIIAIILNLATVANFYYITDNILAVDSTENINIHDIL